MIITPQATHFDHYRPNVGIIVLNDQDQVFVAQRLDSPGPSWQMPQGGIDPGEDPLAAAKRELFEETSISAIDLVAEYPENDAWLYYDLPSELQGKLWGGDFKGQRQKWFIFRFQGTLSQIDLQTEHPEFSDWKWVGLSDIPDLAVPFKKELYTQLHEVVKNFLTK